VGEDDTDQGDAGEVVALADHLRAHQHVDLARGEGRVDPVEAAGAGSRIAVESGHACPGQSLPQALLEPLGPRAQDQELIVAALATLPPPHAEVAVVAAQALGGAMVGQAHVAVGAGGALATGGAEDEGGVPPAVEEEDRLLAPLEGGKELLEEASR